MQSPEGVTMTAKACPTQTAQPPHSPASLASPPSAYRARTILRVRHIAAPVTRGGRPAGIRLACCRIVPNPR
ncbi:hypothetical protein GCM10011320_14240 [Neoroseomonas lacus]|uniref:Uncharacterized protein n=1 Tax=Neoroseomonas lacus TaxID=287609 RepID=A0A917NKP3_9PROT|nr:hypothetical protein GCM10011320_14240 [Neoroseomonas lacus]